MSREVYAFLVAAAAVCCVIGYTTPVAASGTRSGYVTTKREVVSLLEIGKYREACERLGQVSEDTDDLDIVFLRGQCRYGMGDYEAAAFEYRRMLERNTNLPRVRFELARTLVEMGRMKEARAEYQRLLQEPLPPAVRRRVIRRLQMIDERRRWGGVFSIGFMRDSNVNVSPTDPNITVFGLPFVLTPSSLRKSDTGLIASVNAGRYFDGPFEREWRFDVYGNTASYHDLSDYDSTSIGFTVSPQLRLGRAWVGVPAGFTHAWQGGKPLARYYYLGLSIARDVSPSARALSRFTVTYTDDRLPEDSANGWSASLEADAQLSLMRGGLLEGGIAVTRNNAHRDRYFRYTDISLRAGWHGILKKGFRMSVQPAYRIKRYDDADPVDGGVVRRDRLTEVLVSLYKDVSYRGRVLTPVFSVNWSHNRSNVKRRRYERMIYALQLRLQF